MMDEGRGTIRSWKKQKSRRFEEKRAEKFEVKG